LNEAFQLRVSAAFADIFLVDHIPYFDGLMLAVERIGVDVSLVLLLLLVDGKCNSIVG